MQIGRTQSTKYYFAKVSTREKVIYTRTDFLLNYIQKKQVNALQTRFQFSVKKDPQLTLFQHFIN